MGAKDDEKARRERLAAALRENLKRRKAQSRGRAAQSEGDAPAPDEAANEAGTGAPPDPKI